jgi:uncharacterized membrane-anchored protein
MHFPGMLTINIDVENELDKLSGCKRRLSRIEKHMYKFIKRILVALLLSPLLAFGQLDVQAELGKLNWVNGPATGEIGAKASIHVPKDYVFLGEHDTRRFIELMGNPPSDKHYLIAPKSLNWFAVFSFNASGYVKDDEKIDADALLKQMKENDASSNEERKKLGMQTLFTDGWQVSPHYDTQTKRLEWGMRLRSGDGQMNVNYTSRILGRSGVMSAILVSDLATLEKDTNEFKAALQKFSYNAGETYTEFKQGDKIAEYGLAALVLGGAAAVATKKGFWAVIGGFLAAFWKVLAAAAVAGIAGLASLFKKKN